MSFFTTINTERNNLNNIGIYSDISNSSQLIHIVESTKFSFRFIFSVSQNVETVFATQMIILFFKHQKSSNELQRVLSTYETKKNE